MFKRISVDEVKELIDTNDVEIFDVRDEASYSKGHMQNSILLSKENFQEALQNIAKDKYILVYCFHGNSSQMIAQLLAHQGFTNVYSMDGGYAAWSEKFKN